MTRPRFLEGATVALALALAAGVGLPGLGWMMPAATAARVLTALLSLAYLLYLLGRTRGRAGRAVIVAAWALCTGVPWVAGAPLSLYLLAHLTLLWLARVLFFHPGPVAALADLGLTGAALVSAVGAYLHTGSLALAVWCLFLVQALFVLIPPNVRGAERGPADDPFERAYRTAETAIRRLSTPR